MRLSKQCHYLFKSELRPCATFPREVNEFLAHCDVEVLLVVVEAVKLRWQDIIHPALMECSGVSSAKLQTNAFPIFTHARTNTANPLLARLSEEMQFAERFPASLSP